MVFESGVVSEDMRSVVIVPLYRGTGEGLDAGIIGVVEKMYTGILVDRVRRVTGGFD